MQSSNVFAPLLKSAVLTGLLLAALVVGLGRRAAGEESRDEAARRADAKQVFDKKVDPFVKKYCVSCHNTRPEAGINFLAALKNPGSTSATLHWRKAVANVKVHDMPPADAGRIPTDEERRQFVEWVGKIKYLAERDPGPFVIRRLTKVEYGKTLRDLYGVDPTIADRLPDEVFGEGYLNSISPLQSELFLGIANDVLDRVTAAEGEPRTELQKRLFGEVPSEDDDLRTAAREVARSLARQGYRRPATEAELDVLVDVFDLARDNEMDYEASLGLMFKAVLVSPQFLFITPAGSVDAKEEIVRLDDHQLASRLSYLLWSAPPDAELSALADEGKLHDPDVLRTQAERLLMDPRSRALFDGFGAQWLGVGGLESQTFDPDVFPQMTPALQRAMVEEARLFFESVLRENQSVVRFVDGDYTFLNGDLAKVYGLGETVSGPDMRRVRLTDDNRGGVLGMPATLATTSFPNRTSPVRRGVWVLEQILGEHVPPPPADVPELDDQDEKSVEGLTLRQRTELHQKDATCANCHRVLDPIGFGLENFDAIGRWREKDTTGEPIDSVGKLPDGKTFTSPAHLKKLLAARETDLARNVTDRLTAYALGRQLEGYDEIVVDRMMERIAADDHRLKTIVLEIVTSYLFTHRRVKG